MGATQSKSPKVIVLGDLALHTMIVAESGDDDSVSQYPYRGCRREPFDPVLPELIRSALRDKCIVAPDDTVIPDYPSLCKKFPRLAKLASSCGELISVLDLYPEGSTSRKDDRTTLRVRSEFLVAPETVDGDSSSGSTEETFSKLLGHVEGMPIEKGSLLVLYDHGALLRNAISKIDPTTPESFGKILSNASLGIVIGINGDLKDLRWLAKIEAIRSSEMRGKTIVQVTADSLRKAGLKITKFGSLEETVKDIFNQLMHRPLKQLLDFAGHLVIVFSETGALYINNTNETCEGSLHFCPNFDRIAQSDPRTYGLMPGKFSIFLVSLVKEIFRAGTHRDAWCIADAVRLGAVAYNRHFRQGLGQDRRHGTSAGPRSAVGSTPERRNSDLKFHPFAALESALSPEICEELAKGVANREKPGLLVSSLDIGVTDIDKWSRVSSLLEGAEQTPHKQGIELRKIVELGLDATLVVSEKLWKERIEKQGDAPWFPLAYITVPYAAMGKLRLLDHEEIGRHYGLAKVIRKYIETRDWETPLSIAVFGRPGSGKSFGVTQILDAVDPGRKSKPLTFNLAQFNSVDQLTEAFHQIQDRALSSDEVPLAIFDEFDAHFNAPLGWLKYFLAPMQDGLFRGKSGDYKVGRAIFLFAGGTSENYVKFCSPLVDLANLESKAEPSGSELANSTNGKESLRVATANVAQRTPPAEEAKAAAKEAQEIRASKLADFISRLRGSLDVTDINDTTCIPAIGQNSTPTPLTQLRRAVILRSLLELHAKSIFVFSHKDGVKRARIDEDVINSFLSQAKYKHGVRSMEAIIQMSRWVDDRFVPASLPSDELLGAHVEPPFLQRVEAVDVGRTDEMSTDTAPK